jgi:hypothetical protein
MMKFIIPIVIVIFGTMCPRIAFSEDSRSVPLRSAADTPSVSSWSLSVYAGLNGLVDSLAMFGVRPDATAGYDPALDVPHPPPPPGNYIEVYFPHLGGNWPSLLGWKFASDFSTPVFPRWQMAVGSSLNTGTVTLTWDTSSIAPLPAGYEIMMKDSLIGVIIPMRHQHSYTFGIGSGRIFTMWIAYGSFQFSVQSKWNIVSVPIVPVDSSKEFLFPDAASPAFGYDGSYNVRPKLHAGEGYWMRFDSIQNVIIPGTALPSVSVPVIEGWNLIGSVDHEINAPQGGIIVSNVFGYNGSYVQVSKLEPGKGYWVKTSSSGTITLSAAEEQPTMQSDNVAEFPGTSLTFVDSRGSAQTLILQPNESRVGGTKNELPPIPPPEAFDVRFTSNKFWESYGESTTLWIRMQSLRYPVVMVTASVGSSLTGFVDEWKDGAVQSTHELSARGNITLSDPSVQALRLRISNAKTSPKEFLLSQNYPNPFNSSTYFRFQLPHEGFVVVRVYDILGREVGMPVKEAMQPGAHSIPWDASALSSGMYYYSMEYRDKSSGEEIRDVKKLLLIK